MRKNIKSSLFAKVFLITAAMLLFISLLVFGLLAWMMPQTYSNQLNAALDARTQSFIRELERVSYTESAELFRQFAQNPQVTSIELYHGNGELLPLPLEQPENTGTAAYISQEQEEDPVENIPVLSGNYYFSFADSQERYLLTVYGSAEAIAKLQQSFLRVMPFLLSAVLTAAFALSWIFSAIITKPVLELSRISEKMSALQLELEWNVDEQRTDELGTLGKSLNILSRNLSSALAGLQAANRKLENDIAQEKELEKMRTDFFSAVSHELKTPVTIIKGQIEGMLLGIGVYKDREKYLARALETAGTLETMVQELLTVSRLSCAGTSLKMDVVDCVQTVHSYLDETEDLIARKNLQIQLDMPPEAFLCGNKLLMEKVFSNLIGNAVKYAPQGAPVWISIWKNQKLLVFSVENGGTHIPEESLPKLFDAFYRIEQSRSRRTGGSGLGLNIVQKILSLHGSVCTACNTPSGVKFFFSFPQKSQTAPTEITN